MVCHVSSDVLNLCCDSCSCAFNSCSSVSSSCISAFNSCMSAFTSPIFASNSCGCTRPASFSSRTSGRRAILSHGRTSRSDSSARSLLIQSTMCSKCLLVVESVQAEFQSRKVTISRCSSVGNDMRDGFGLHSRLISEAADILVVGAMWRPDWCDGTLICGLSRKALTELIWVVQASVLLG